MKVKTLKCDVYNNGKLVYDPNESILLTIKIGKYIVPNKQNNKNEFNESDYTTHILIDEKEKYFNRKYHLEYEDKIIYQLKMYGNKDSEKGYHVGFSFWEHQWFLWLQKRHWIQKEENIRYCINIIFLLLGLFLSFSKR